MGGDEAEEIGPYWQRRWLLSTCCLRVSSSTIATPPYNWQLLWLFPLKPLTRASTPEEASCCLGGALPCPPFGELVFHHFEQMIQDHHYIALLI